MPDAVLEVYFAFVPSLTRWLQGRFPRTCPGLVSDALSELGLLVVERPTPFERALARGEGELRCLLRCAAWRRLRDLTRRADHRNLQDAENGEDQAVPPGQEFAAGIEARITHLFDVAAEVYGCGRREALHRALEEKVLTGDPDQEVAARHDVPREYLNRAKRFVQRGVLDAALGA